MSFAKHSLDVFFYSDFHSVQGPKVSLGGKGYRYRGTTYADMRGSKRLIVEIEEASSAEWLPRRTGSG